MPTHRPQWCGCKNRCAEEDTGYIRPNERGACQMFAPGNDQSPTELARKIFAAMTAQERKDAKEYGSGEDRIREEAPGWDPAEVADCLDEINRLCGSAYEGDDE